MKYSGYIVTGMEETTPQKNEELINKIAASEECDKDHFAWKLAQLNFPLVMHMLKKYFSGSNEKDNLISDGVLGLYKACTKIRKETPNKMFTTYACQYIYGYMLVGMKKRSGVIKRVQIKGKEVIPDECSYEKFKYDLEDWDAVEDEYTIKRSDGKFCESFFKDIEEYYVERKDNKRPSFFSGNTLEVIENFKLFDTHTDIVEHSDISKQRIDQIRQALFSYAVQTLRDCDEKDRQEFFNVIYGGRYSMNNPPPLNGWRKEFWDEIMSSKDYRSYSKIKECVKKKRNNITNKWRYTK